MVKVKSFMHRMHQSVITADTPEWLGIAGLKYEAFLLLGSAGEITGF